MHGQLRHGDDGRAGRSMVRTRRDGLARWQVARVKAIIAFRLKEGISLGMLADECELPRAHFSRAFKVSLGMTPHELLLARRIELARTLIGKTDLPLSRIAVDCGFCDLSHMSRTFVRIVGMPPGSWRRNHETKIPTRRRSDNSNSSAA
jgi:AraC family transcriptional regulator